MNEQYHILVCDINVKQQGHYIGYSQYILEEFTSIEQNNPGVYISFLFNREAESLLSFNNDIVTRVSFIDLKDRGTLFNRFLIIREIKKHTRFNRIDHLLFMDFDQFQMPFYFMKFKSSISGILFRPHHRIDSSNHTILKLINTSIKRLKKKIAEMFIVNKSTIQNIFILNDKEGVRTLNKVHSSSVFKYLPDPIFTYGLNKSKNIILDSHSDIYRFLIFGSISVRKNISNIIRAYDKAVFLFKTELLIVGQCSEAFLRELNNIINGLSTIDGIYKSIVIKREFVTNDEMGYLFSSSDVCLLIYKDFFGSSGLLGRAALHKLKVIGTNTGLLNELITNYRMGITVDPSNVDEIAMALQGIKKIYINPINFESFYLQHSPERFLNTLAEFVTP